MTDSLAKLDGAVKALAEARTLPEIKDVHDTAKALSEYARAANMGLEAQNHATAITIMARRKGGKLLRNIETKQGNQTGKNQYSKSEVEAQAGPQPKTKQQEIKDAGLTRTTAQRWEQEASVPDEIVDEHIKKTMAAKKELTITSVRKLAKKERKEIIIIPTTTEKRATIIHGRAEKTGLPDNHVDLIITSPPYNLGSQSWPMGGDGRRKWDNGIAYDSLNDAMTPDEYVRWQIDVFIEMWRVAKDGASFFYNHKTRNQDGGLIHPMDWVRHADNPWTLRQEIIWDRTSTHNHSATLFWPEDERIYWMTKGKPNLPNRSIGMSTVWRFHGPQPNTWHPAPFPEELPGRCIEAVGRDGITILDPFAGSFTTIKAALDYGYDVIGIDISGDYVAKGRAAYG